MSSEPAFEASTDLVYIPDHPDRARRRLLSQDWDKPRIVALAEAMGGGAQALEDDTFDVLMGRRLEAATGATLDQWGAIVGEVRGTLDDADYRRFISARVLVNTGDGTVDELIAIFQVITAPSIVWFLPMYPAGFKLRAIRKVWLENVIRRRIRRMMADAKPAGVTMVLIEAIEGYFGFADNPAASGYDVGTFARIL